MDSVGLQSFLLVVTSEMGDKTQLLALVLASKFKKPWTIMAGITVATLFNHGLASLLGAEISALIPAGLLNKILAVTFIAFAVWLLIPDKDEGLKWSEKYGAFVTTTIAFFLAEMGDKTQLATVALGARFQAPVMVTIGTTLGMLVADGLAVFLGEHLTKRISMKWINWAAAALFAIFGIALFFQS